MRTFTPNTWLGAGILAFALGLILFLIPNGISKPSNIRVAVLSPTFWPHIVAWGIGIGGLMLIAQSFFAQSSPPDLEPEHAVQGNPWLRLSALAIIMAVFYALIPLTGLVIGSALTFLAIILVIRSQYRLTALIAAIALPLAVYGFFNHIAGVPIPQGQWIRLP